MNPIASTPRPAAARLRGGGNDDGEQRHLAVAAAFLGSAIVSAIVPATAALGSWLPLHLLLAGAASTAIAGVMPFFSTAVSNAPPPPVPVRVAGVLGIALGTTLIVGGRAIGGDGMTVAGIGGLAFLTGVVATAATTLLPLRSALGARRLFMGAVYGVALINITVGATLATGFLFAWQPIVTAWAVLKPAHAWLNLFGFVSLVIAGSLLHLLPTVVGSRIRRTRASIVCFVALAAGPQLVAVGFALRVDSLALVGASATIVGSLALAWHAVSVVRARGRWTTDHHWHLLTTWSLVVGIGWFGVASVIALAQVVSGGATPAGWSLAPLVVPLAVGWAAQVLIGAWSHLVPAIGPGSSEQHARQRSILGWAGPWRLVALNAGLLAVTAGQLLDMRVLIVSGAGLAFAAGGLAVALLVGALLVLARSIGRTARDRPAMRAH